jgi:hypothetical protein
MAEDRRCSQASQVSGLRRRTQAKILTIILSFPGGKEDKKNPEIRTKPRNRPRKEWATTKAAVSHPNPAEAVLASRIGNQIETFF